MFYIFKFFQIPTFHENHIQSYYVLLYNYIYHSHIQFQAAVEKMCENERMSERYYIKYVLCVYYN